MTRRSSERGGLEVTPLPRANREAPHRQSRRAFAMRCRHDPIVAIATAPGRGAVGIVRVSGRGLAAADRGALRPRAARRARRPTCRSSTPTAQPIDQGLALYFPAPHSYTGEDVLELQAHGGPVVLQLLLARCLRPRRADAHGRARLPACAWPSRASSPSAPSSTTSSTWRRPRRWPT